MAECEFDLILEEWAESEWNEFADAPEFKTSKRHDRAMQRIFRRYERNTRKLRPRTDIGIRNTRKRLLVAVLVIILAVLSGCAAYVMSKSFRVEEQGKYTEITLLSFENCPTVIEDKYYLSGLPEEFDLIDIRTPSVSEQPYIVKCYKNKQPGKLVYFKQYVKPWFRSQRYQNFGRIKFVETEINGHSGLFADHSVEGYDGAWVLWDNGDYLLSVMGDLPKIDILNLAKSTKIL